MTYLKILKIYVPITSSRAVLLLKNCVLFTIMHTRVLFRANSSLLVRHLGGSLAVVRSYTLGCEPLVTGNLAMGLTIRSSHKQELSSVYQFIDVLYSLCIYEALRH